MEKWRNVGEAHLAVSAVCEAEILYGLEKRNSKRLWLEYKEYLEDRLVLLPMDKSIAAIFGDLKATMEVKGTPRADFDLIIAATAIRHGLVLATLNGKHFIDIPGLSCEIWT